MEDSITLAVREAIKPIMKQEKTWDCWKLESRMTSYFRSAVKGFDFDAKPWDELVYEMCWNVFNSIFSALQDRKWLNQLDLLQAFRISVRALLPPTSLAEVSTEEFEQTVLCAHDQAYEEQRFGLILYEVLTSQIKEKKMRTRVYGALEAGRRDAARIDLAESNNLAEGFARNWIACSLDRLRAECGGQLEYLFQPLQVTWLFQTLIDNGAFPVSLIAHCGPLPPKWPILATAVQAAYGSKGKGKGTSKIADPATRKLSLYSVATGENSPAKRLKGSSDGEGHPLCTQAEDCLGNPAAELLRHIEETGEEGDLYCSVCWSALVSGDPMLKAVPVSDIAGRQL
jgi:hypothetical protein